MVPYAFWNPDIELSFLNKQKCNPTFLLEMKMISKTPWIQTCDLQAMKLERSAIRSN